DLNFIMALWLSAPKNFTSEPSSRPVVLHPVPIRDRHTNSNGMTAFDWIVMAGLFLRGDTAAGIIGRFRDQTDWGFTGQNLWCGTYKQSQPAELTADSPIFSVFQKGGLGKVG